MLMKKAVTLTETTIPVNTNPLGTGFINFSTVAVVPSITIGAALPSINPFAAKTNTPLYP